MKVSALLGVDLGTSSVKGVAFDLTGRALASREIPCGYTIPQPGWAEADALVWWDAVRLILRELTEAVSASQVAAVGITGQAPTLPDDETGGVYERLLAARKQLYLAVRSGIRIGTDDDQPMVNKV